MADYIRREDYCEENCGKENREGYKTCKNCSMLNVPSANVQPVKCGRWEQIGEQSAKCTACGGVLKSNGIDKTGKALIFNAVYHYCPYCGARMDLGDEKT